MAADDNLLARADLARFLSACYYEPGPAFAEEKLFDSLLAVAEQADPELGVAAARLRGAFAAERLDDLLLDYTRLFLGPNEVVARPYGSVWLEDERTLMGETTVSVVELYRRGGFEIDESFRELPDHIACELEFLYLLLFRQAQAIAGANGEDLGAGAADADAGTRTVAVGGGRGRAFVREDDVVDLKRRLLGEHLGRWVSPFTAAVAAGAQTPFYRELADLTGQVVRFEADRAR